MKKILIIKIILIIVLMKSYSQQISEDIIILSDAPVVNSDSSNVKKIEGSYDTYEEAIAKWKSYDEVNMWIKDYFEYDMSRAMQLASNSENREKTSIYTAEETYNSKSGVCLDLSRFAFETILEIDENLNPKYLMIEFEPLIINGKKFEKHWIVLFETNNQFFVMADSKRPGHMSGPYDDLSQFILEYEKFRQRDILSYKVLDTYKKRMKKMRLKEKKGKKEEK